jgi:flagellar capping protein FliD
VEQLATAQRLNSAAFLAGSGAVVGTGALTLTSGTNSFSVDISASNNTLAGIRDAINSSTSNTSVQASVIQAADGARLVLAASDAPVPPALNADTARALDVPLVTLNEPSFRYALNEDAMATEKLAEGIRAFALDTVKLEQLMLQHR